jgi:hypothetical protein
LGEIGQNEHIWPKWSKNAQKVKFENFPPKQNCAIFLNNQKYVSMAKMRNMYSSVWEKWPK